MLRALAIIMLLLLASPSCTPAGWGDALRNADKLIRDAPKPPPIPRDEAPAPSADSGEEQGATPPGTDDEHYIQPDDYFVQHHGLEKHAWIYVELAKAVTVPSSDTKGEGEFMKVRDGQNYWTKHYWRTRIASKEELKLGLHVIAFNNNHRDGVYRAPDKKSKARGGAWFYAKITDMSDMFKGFVTVSGNYKVGLKNIRVPIQ